MFVREKEKKVRILRDGPYLTDGVAGVVDPITLATRKPWLHGYLGSDLPDFDSTILGRGCNCRKEVRSEVGLR